MSRPATTRLLRRLNAERVLHALRETGPLRVTELVARTGLSRPTVDAVAGDLLRLGWLGGLAPGRPPRGRPARRLSFRAPAGGGGGVPSRGGQGRAGRAALTRPGGARDGG